MKEAVEILSKQDLDSSEALVLVIESDLKKLGYEPWLMKPLSQSDRALGLRAWGRYLEARGRRFYTRNNKVSCERWRARRNSHKDRRNRRIQRPFTDNGSDQEHHAGHFQSSR